MTSDNMMDLTSLPRSMVILGAGVVGCEFATIFANFGQTKIYLIDQADRILPFEDEDVSRICSTNLEAKGVTIHHRARLLSMEVVDDQVEYTIEHYTGGEEAIRVECAMISVGRVPNILGLDLDKAGVAVNDQGRIIIIRRPLFPTFTLSVMSLLIRPWSVSVKFKVVMSSNTSMKVPITCYPTITCPLLCSLIPRWQQLD